MLDTIESAIRIVETLWIEISFLFIVLMIDITNPVIAFVSTVNPTTYKETVE
jgi:hypothetical protein